MNRLAVLGQPIGHSLSPEMHSAAFEALGIGAEWSYEAIELGPEVFAEGVSELREQGYRGVNVTVPHKRAALALSSDPSRAATEIGAANTLSFTADGIRADNTDAPGLITALPFDPDGARAIVLGAGGAARAAAWALAAVGALVTVSNRTSSRATDLAAELGLEAIDPPGDLPVGDYDVLVNATSVGLARPGSPAEDKGSGLKSLRIRADELSDRLVVVDLVYGSSATELTQAAMRAGATVVDGREILVRQGAESFRIWTGLEPPLEAMRAAIQPSDDEPPTERP